jgi:hypothetical protein
VKGTDHVIWDNLAPREPLTLSPEQQLVLRCTHCGDRYVLALPAPVDMIGALIRVYTKGHRHCKPREPKP